jgi:type IV secretory pathway TrbL component
MDQTTQLMSAKFLENLQLGFIDKINASLSLIQSYSMTILYSLIIIELVAFGLIWAFRGSNSFGDFIIKVFKIGVFISFVRFFPDIINIIINGFAYVGFKVVSDKAAIYLFNPGKVWMLGFKPGVALLKMSVEYGTLNIGMTFIYLMLGFGILILFAVIGAQIILTVSLFYIVSLVVLLLAPFGVLSSMSSLFYRSLKSLIQAGVRVLVIVIVLGVAYAVWTKMGVPSIDVKGTLEKPLALFFSALVFSILLYKLPPIVAESVGDLTFSIFANNNSGGNESGSYANVSVSHAGGSAVSYNLPGKSSAGSKGDTGFVPASGAALSAASVVSAGGAGGAGSSMVSGSSASVSTAGASIVGVGKSERSLGKAASVRQSISEETVKKLKK